MATTNLFNSDYTSTVEGTPSSGITTEINVGKGERIASAIGGAALSIYGITKGSPLGFGLAVAGSFLIYRGASGNCPVNSIVGRNTAGTSTHALEIVENITVNKSRSEVYSFWRRLSNLPLFMKHIEEVVENDELHSSWKAQIPGNLGSISWQAEITEQEQDRVIAWRSLPGATIDNAGRVEFKDAPGDQGTEVKAVISYNVPAGSIGSNIAKLFNPLFSKIIKEDIRGFKQYLETGELPTNQGQPTGKKNRKDDLRNLNVSRY